MRNRKTLLCALLVLAMLFSFMPDKVQAEEASAKLELHAFYPAQMTFSDNTKKYIDALDSISFAWGRIYSDLEQGVVTELGKNGNTMFYYPEDYIDVLKYAKSMNKSLQLNVFSDSTNAVKILPYKEQREKAIAVITDSLTSDVTSGSAIYFDGVVIDIEGLQNKDNKGNLINYNGKAISAWYTQFLKELKIQLKAINKQLFVAVNPLLNYSGYDYKEIASVADRMIIMAHDYEPVTKLSKAQVMEYTGYNSLYPIDSLSPIKKIKMVMEDVKKYVDKVNYKKVMLQINFDAAQWRYSVESAADWYKTPGTLLSMEERNTPTYEMIASRVKNADKKASGMTYGYNNELQSPFVQFFNVPDKTYNVLLYEDAKSVTAKIDLIKQYGLGGVSLWSLGNVPDYTDKISKAYGLNLWDTIITKLPIKAPASQGTKVTFSDKVVELAVRKQLMRTTGTIYSNELATVYRLAVPAGVKSLVDLKKLPNLEYLDLSNAKLTNISGLSNLKNLRVLYLQRNEISDISPLKGLVKLEVLSLNGNRISSASALAAMTSLRELYIRDNRIADYSPLVNLKKLNVLYLKGNKATNYSKLANIKKGLLEKDF